jgi:6-pyruvoyltetrahydropterin/6-carboxytetrahydropterin synthase
MLIRKLFKAEMAHTTMGAYTTRCHHMHGHSYKFELFLRSDEPNPAHMVSDFKSVKDLGVNDFFDSFDHAVTMWNKDPRAAIIKQINPDRHILVPFNPTAEMLSKAFFLVAQAIFDTGRKLSGEKNVKVAQVIVHETDTGYAVYTEADRAADQFPDVKLAEWVISDGIKADWKDPDWYERALVRLKTSGPS